MLNFILGPSGSGKSQQMLAALRARAERGERSILIVPEQFTSSTEGVLFRTLGDSLSAYVELPPIADGYWKMVDRNPGTSAYTNVSLCVYDEATGAAYLLTMDI